MEIKRNGYSFFCGHPKPVAQPAWDEEQQEVEPLTAMTYLIVTLFILTIITDAVRKCDQIRGGSGLDRTVVVTHRAGTSTREVQTESPIADAELRGARGPEKMRWSQARFCSSAMRVARGATDGPKMAAACVHACRDTE